MARLIFDRWTGPVRVVVTEAGQLQMLEGDRVVDLKPREAQRLAGQMVGGDLDCDLQTFEVARALGEAVDVYRWEFGDREEHIAPGTLTASHRDLIAEAVRAVLEGLPPGHNVAEEDPHDGQTTNLPMRQADRLASPEIDDPLNNEPKRLIAETRSTP